jgi:carbon monoxide dehydrogenase subunit G
MSRVTASVEIDAPPDAVWDVVMDPDRLGDWVTIHRRVSRVSDRPLREGSTLAQSLRLRGATFKVRWKVAELEGRRAARWEGRGPARSEAHIGYRLVSRDGGGTCFEYENEFKAPLGPLGAAASRALMGGLPQREANASLQRLKSLLEHRGAG